MEHSTLKDGRCGYEVTRSHLLAYALGAVGHLFCLDAMTGRMLWSRDLGKEYKIQMPEWGIAAAPLMEDNLVIVHIGGSNGACLVVFDRKTGQEQWRALEVRLPIPSPSSSGKPGNGFWYA